MALPNFSPNHRESFRDNFNKPQGIKLPEKRVAPPKKEEPPKPSALFGGKDVYAYDAGKTIEKLGREKKLAPKEIKDIKDIILEKSVGSRIYESGVSAAETKMKNRTRGLNAFDIENQKIISSNKKEIDFLNKTLRGK
jgi:hypothetical protein